MLVVSSTNVFADTAQESSIDVKTIVPHEFMEQYEGVFHSKQEVLDAFGLSLTKDTSGTDTSSTEVSYENIDEFAAYVAYVYGAPQDISNEPSSSDNGIGLFASKSKTFTETLYEFAAAYEIQGKVTLTYDETTKVITKTTASSQLLGFVTFVKWTPNTPVITVISNYIREVDFSGVLTTKFLGEEIISKDISGTMRVYSTPVIGLAK